MRSLLLASVLIGTALMGAGAAQADEPEIRELINCQPGESFAKLADALGGLDADKLDTINTSPSFSFTVLDGGPLPSRIFHRSEAGAETDLPFSDDGEVTDFVQLFRGGDKAEFCVEDPARAGKPKGESDTYSVSMSVNMNFINASGTYSIEELRDGAKDGKAAIRRMMGGAEAVFAPSLTHIHLAYKDKPAAPDIQGCTAAGLCKALAFKPLEDNYLFALQALEDMNAAELRIGGGDHVISPSMDFDKMVETMVANKDNSDD